MREVIHSLALVVGVLALLGAALRLVSPAAPRGVERIVAVVVVAVTLAVAEALALGLVGLGAAPLALVAAAVGTWLAARRLRPAPVVGPWDELRAWWDGLGPAARAATAALAGAAAAWVAWQLRYPSIGFDSALYHYPLVAGWIENGRPGSQLALSYDIPYGSYPLTDEVALTWGAGLARSWVPLGLWNPALLLVLAGAGWVALRNLAVPAVAAALGAAALVTQPLVVRQLNEPQTDLPALAWLAATAALATGARRSPGLLVPALLAAGLAVGTKPSTAPLAVTALAVGAWWARARLRGLAAPLALGLAGAVAVGGAWYLRNLAEHGSPLWPFVEGPWGDPRPAFFAALDGTFLERPGASLDGRLAEYRERLGGGALLLAAAPLVAGLGLLGGRRRPGRLGLVLAGGVALAALLVWSTAWGTGVVRDTRIPWAEGFSLSALRYLLPALGAAVVAVGLAARQPAPVGPVAAGVLGLAVAWNVVEDATLGAPYTPGAHVPLLGALLGLASLGAAIGLGRLLARRPPPRGAVPAPALGLAAAALVAVIVAAAGPGYVERSLDIEDSSAYGRPLVGWFVAGPGFAEGDAGVAFASRGVLAQLAGDSFDHPLELVPRRASCAAAEELARRGALVATEPPFLRGFLGVVDYSVTPRRCFAGRPPAFAEGPFRVYRIRPAGARASAAPRRPSPRAAGR